MQGSGGSGGPFKQNGFGGINNMMGPEGGWALLLLYIFTDYLYRMYRDYIYNTYRIFTGQPPVYDINEHQRFVPRYEADNTVQENQDLVQVIRRGVNNIPVIGGQQFVPFVGGGNNINQLELAALNELFEGDDRQILGGLPGNLPGNGQLPEETIRIVRVSMFVVHVPNGAVHHSLNGGIGDSPIDLSSLAEYIEFLHSLGGQNEAAETNSYDDDIAGPDENGGINTQDMMNLARFLAQRIATDSHRNTQYRFNPEASNPINIHQLTEYIESQRSLERQYEENAALGVNREVHNLQGINPEFIRMFLDEHHRREGDYTIYNPINAIMPLQINQALQMAGVMHQLQQLRFDQALRIAGIMHHLQGLQTAELLYQLFQVIRAYGQNAQANRLEIEDSRRVEELVDEDHNANTRPDNEEEDQDRDDTADLDRSVIYEDEDGNILANSAFGNGGFALEYIEEDDREEDEDDFDNSGVNFDRGGRGRSYTRADDEVWQTYQGEGEEVEDPNGHSEEDDSEDEIADVDKGNNEAAVVEPGSLLTNVETTFTQAMGFDPNQDETRVAGDLGIADLFINEE